MRVTLISAIVASLLVCSSQATQYVFKEYPITQPKNSYCPGKSPPAPARRTCTTIEFPVQCNMTSTSTSTSAAPGAGTDVDTNVDLAACIEGFKTLYRNITTDESTWDCLSIGNKVTVVDGPKCVAADVDDSGQGEGQQGLDLGLLGGGSSSKDDENGSSKTSSHDVDDESGSSKTSAHDADNDDGSNQTSAHDSDNDNGSSQTSAHDVDDESGSSKTSAHDSDNDGNGSSQTNADDVEKQSDPDNQGEEQTQSQSQSQSEFNTDDELTNAINGSAAQADESASASESDLDSNSDSMSSDEYATALNDSSPALPPKARPYGNTNHQHKDNPHQARHVNHHHHNGDSNLTPSQIDDLFSNLDADTPCNLQVTLRLTSADQNCQVQNFFMYWVNTTHWNITSTLEQPKGKFERVRVLDECLA